MLTACMTTILKERNRNVLTRCRFLLAQVYLDGLEELTNSNDADGVRDSTWEMLETYHTQHTHYCDFLERLSSRIQSHGGYTDARRALTLVAISSQQLTTIELQYVLSTSFMKSSEGDWPEINDILLACAGLLEINDWRNTISLSHDFVRDFLQENLGADLATGKADLAALCIDYVSSGAFDTGPCSNEDDFKERLQSHPFYSYAATNWGSYAYKGLIRTSRVVDFLSSESAAQAAGQALMMSELPIEYAPKSISGLHLAAIFKLYDAAELLLRNSTADPRTSHHFTPLMYAAGQGFLSLASLFISAGADVNAKDIQGRTSLHLVAMNGHHNLVNRLVSLGADINAIDDRGLSPLHMAAEETDYETASLLVRLGATVNCKDYMGWTPLLRATMNGCSRTVELLLRSGASIKDADINSVGLLSIAAIQGQSSILSTLLKKGADVDARDKQGWTPLLHAAANRHNSSVVSTLLEWGADIQAKEEDGWDPLLIATSMGHEAVVQRLLRHGADIKSTVKGG